MSGKGSSPTGAQNQDEKKDHPRRGGGHRGQEDNEHFEDPRWEQAEGARTPHSQPGSSGGKSSQGGQPQKTDNTEPGGNRPKGRGAHHSRTDHD
jgi:hypothetical protein